MPQIPYTIQSCIKLELLMRFYWSPKPLEGYQKSPAGDDAFTYLYIHGLVDRGDEMARITERGRFYIRHILSTPFPQETYFIPERTNDVASG